MVVVAKRKENERKHEIELTKDSNIIISSSSSHRCRQEKKRKANAKKN